MAGDLDEMTLPASESQASGERGAAGPRSRTSSSGGSASTGWLSSSRGHRSRTLRARHPPRRPLPHRRARRPRRHGRGVSRRRSEARPAGRAEVPAPRRRPRSDPTDSAAHRSPHGPAGVAPQRLPRLRHRRDRRRDVPLHGVRRRRRPRLAAAPHRPIPRRSRARTRAPDLRGPRRRARTRRHPSRPQARQRDARRDGQNPHHRLRSGRRIGPGDSRRHASLHGARATLGRRSHGAERHLFPRTGALRSLHRPARARREESG